MAQATTNTYSAADVLNAATDPLYMGGIHDITFKAEVLMFILAGQLKNFQQAVKEMIIPAQGESVSGGTYIKELLEFDQAHTGTYKNEVEYVPSQIAGYAGFPLGVPYSSAVVGRDESIQNLGPSALYDLANLRVTNAVKSLGDKIGRLLYEHSKSGSGEDREILPLYRMFGVKSDCTKDASSVAYAMLAESTNSNWAPKVLRESTAEGLTEVSKSTAGSEFMGTRLLQKLLAMPERGQSAGNQIDNIIMNQDCWNTMERLLQTSSQYMSEDHKGFADHMFQHQTLRGGTVNLVVSDNLPNTSGDSDATDIIGINSRKLKFRVHAKGMEQSKWMPKDNDPHSAQMHCIQICQLTTTDRSAHALMTGIYAAE